MFFMFIIVKRDALVQFDPIGSLKSIENEPECWYISIVALIAEWRLTTEFFQTL